MMLTLFVEFEAEFPELYAKFDENLAILADNEFVCLLVCNITRLSVMSGQILANSNYCSILRSIEIK